MLLLHLLLLLLLRLRLWHLTLHPSYPGACCRTRLRLRLRPRRQHPPITDWRLRGSCYLLLNLQPARAGRHACQLLRQADLWRVAARCPGPSLEQLVQVLLHLSLEVLFQLRLQLRQASNRGGAASGCRRRRRRGHGSAAGTGRALLYGLHGRHVAAWRRHGFPARGAASRRLSLLRAADYHTYGSSRRRCSGLRRASGCLQLLAACRHHVEFLRPLGRGAKVLPHG